MVNIKLIGLTALLGLLAIFCGFFVCTSQYEKPDMKGHIINIPDAQSSYNNDIIGSILVEDNNQSTKFSVRVNKETNIFKLQRNEQHSITFNELKKGQNVEIKFIGPILESYPAQATADKIVILEK